LGIVYDGSSLSEAELLNAMWLELRSDRIDDLKEKILAFGVKQHGYPQDALHFYFQAPGGQVFRLAGTEEDLNLYRPHNRG
jgi:hypothetical protein